MPYNGWGYSYSAKNSPNLIGTIQRLRVLLFSQNLSQSHRYHTTAGGTLIQPKSRPKSSVPYNGWGCSYSAKNSPNLICTIQRLGVLLFSQNLAQSHRYHTTAGGTLIQPKSRPKSSVPYNGWGYSYSAKNSPNLICTIQRQGVLLFSQKLSQSNSSVQRLGVLLFSQKLAQSHLYHTTAGGTLIQPKSRPKSSVPYNGWGYSYSAKNSPNLIGTIQRLRVLLFSQNLSQSHRYHTTAGGALIQPKTRPISSVPYNGRGYSYSAKNSPKVTHRYNGWGYSYSAKNSPNLIGAIQRLGVLLFSQNLAQSHRYHTTAGGTLIQPKTRPISSVPYNGWGYSYSAKISPKVIGTIQRLGVLLFSQKLAQSHRYHTTAGGTLIQPKSRPKSSVPYNGWGYSYSAKNSPNLICTIQRQGVLLFSQKLAQSHHYHTTAGGTLIQPKTRPKSSVPYNGRGYSYSA